MRSIELKFKYLKNDSKLIRDTETVLILRFFLKYYKTSYSRIF
jgi:hypothetical protein